MLYRPFAAVFAYGAAALLWASCTKDVPPGPVPFEWVWPAHFPAPAAPPDNIPTAERVALGKKLFYDPALSRDSSLSCATCHRPSLAFADDRPTTPGIEGRPGTRNVPSLANVAYLPYVLREGGVPTLEMQVLVPIQEHNEFDFNILRAIARLNRMPEYRGLAQEAYGRDSMDAFVVTRALAAFERTLISGDAPFDRWQYGGNSAAVSAAARRGYALFHGPVAQCGVCHSGVLFTTQGFANNGLYADYSADPGRFRHTGDPADVGVFKIPSLRNVAVTAPYMFDGSLPDLEAVLDHYSGGGSGHPNQHPALRPFALSPAERADLIAFLESLTDRGFLENKAFR